MVCVGDCDTKHPRTFEQPVIQTLQMFIGEMGCWLVIGIFAMVKRYRNTDFAGRKGRTHLSTPAVETDPLLVRDEDGAASEDEYDGEEDPLAASMTLSMQNRRPLTGMKVCLLALPACCDIMGTTLMNVGLLFVAASIYQMTRGALVLFVGLFSVVFLKRYLGLYKWFALFVVVSGVALVGLAGAIEKKREDVGVLFVHAVQSLRYEIEMAEAHTALQTVVGCLLIAGAQIFTAAQFVLEESIMEKYAIEPLKAVGWEGVWGFTVTLLGMIILHFAYGQTDAGKGGYFDMREGLWEVLHFRSIAVSSVLIMISIGFAPPHPVPSSV